MITLLVITLSGLQCIPFVDKGLVLILHLWKVEPGAQQGQTRLSPMESRLKQIHSPAHHMLVVSYLLKQVF